MSSRKVWRGWNRGELQIHFIQTGVGEAVFYIFPDGTTLLQDCGDHAAITAVPYAVPVMPGPHRLAGDWIARYIERVLSADTPRKNGFPLIDYMLVTHFHQDHTGSCRWQTRRLEGKPLPGCFRSGFGIAAETLAFGTAVDRGWPDYTDPIPVAFKEELDHMLRIYKALGERDGMTVEKFRVGAEDQFVQKRGEYKNFVVQNIASSGKILCRDGSVRDLYAVKDGPREWVNENGMSTGFLLRYGDFSFFTAADFSDRIYKPDGSFEDIEELLAPEVPSVDVAKLNHHGGVYTMPAALIRALSARVWINCLSDQRDLSEDTLERLTDRSIYPGPRTIFPGVLASPRLEQAAGKAYLKDIVPESFGNGCHAVITVPEGGRTYRITCISCEDESMQITGEYDFSVKRTV